MARVAKRVLGDNWRVKYESCLVRHLSPRKGEAPLVLLRNDYTADDEGYVTKVLCDIYSTDDNGHTNTNTRRIMLKNLDLSYLPVGVINLERSTFIVKARCPEGSARYRSALSMSSLSILDPLQRIREKLDSDLPREVSNAQLLSSWAKNELQDPAEALRRVDSSGWLASAFSSKFQFSISENTDNTVLMYLDRVAGEVVDGRIQLEGWASRFKEGIESYGLEVAA